MGQGSIENAKKSNNWQEIGKGKRKSGEEENGRRISDDEEIFGRGEDLGWTGGSAEGPRRSPLVATWIALNGLIIINSQNMIK